MPTPPSSSSSSPSSSSSSSLSPAPPLPVPAERRGPRPYLSCQGAAAAIGFYQQAFGATLVTRMDMPDGRVGHAELRLLDGLVMVADEFPDLGFVSPRALGGTPVTLHAYVDDVDALFARAAAAGAKILRPLENKFYGERTGHLEDPAGHRWMLSTVIEVLTQEEIERRAKDAPAD